MAEIDNRLDQAVRNEKLCTGGVKDLLSGIPYQEHLQIVRDLAARNPSLDLQVAPGSTNTNFSFEMKLPTAAGGSPIADKAPTAQVDEIAKILGMSGDQFRAQMQKAEREGNSGAVNFFHEDGITSTAFSGTKTKCSDIKKLF